MIFAGGLFKAKKLEAAATTAAAEATFLLILLLLLLLSCSLRCHPPACPGPGTLLGRRCIRLKYTGLEIVLHGGSLTEAAMPALFCIPTNKDVNKYEYVNNIALEKQ
jgi:hypothetical protein